MTIWNIHFLNARHQLTPIMSEVRAAARQAVALAADRADLPDFDLIVRAGTEVVPEWGVSGRAPEAGVIELVVNPARFQPDFAIRALVRQMFHLIRWDGPGRGKSLGEALVGEGLAGHFVLLVLGGKPDPWDATRPSSGLSRRALNEWSRLGVDHGEWFAGKGKLRKWSGFGLGHRLIGAYLAQAPDQDALSLALARADSFRETMRQLAKADGGQELPEDDDAAPPDNAGAAADTPKDTPAAG